MLEEYGLDLRLFIALAFDLQLLSGSSEFNSFFGCSDCWSVACESDQSNDTSTALVHPFLLEQMAQSEPFCCDPASTP